MSERQKIEDALKYLYDVCSGDGAASPEGLAAAVGLTPEQASTLLARMEAAGLVARDGAAMSLRPEGREYALQVVRAHRLYETYLAQRTGLRPAAWHDRANAAEHALTRAQVEHLAGALGDPRYDPHGDPIPTAAGEMPSRRGKSLATQPAGWAGRVLHVEDEPPDLFRSLAAAGFAPDVRLRVESRTATRLAVRIDGQVVDLSAAATAQVTVDDLPAGEHFDATITCLSSLRAGERAEVVSISPLIRGLARSRLLDLGFVPGTVLEVELAGPAGDPVAYAVRGASIALRREQSDRILVHIQKGRAA